MKPIIPATRVLYFFASLVLIAVAIMAKELDLTPDYARRGWEYYVENKIWPIDASVNIEGMNVATQIYWEASQSKGTPPSGNRYVDQSYQKQALTELAGR